MIIKLLPDSFFVPKRTRQQRAAGDECRTANARARRTREVQREEPSPSQAVHSEPRRRRRSDASETRLGRATACSRKKKQPLNGNASSTLTARSARRFGSRLVRAAFGCSKRNACERAGQAREEWGRPTVDRVQLINVMLATVKELFTEIPSTEAVVFESTILFAINLFSLENIYRKAVALRFPYERKLSA